MKKFFKKIPQHKIRHLSTLLLKFRSLKGLSQNDLAVLAGVSTKTINAIENESLEIIGPRALSKIANALDQDATLWLESVGYKNVPPEKLDGSLSRPGKTSADAFFDRLAENSSPESPALLCLTFLSKVGPVNRDALTARLSDLLKKGSLWVALIAPYPEQISDKLSGTLAAHYREIHADVKKLAATLDSGLQPDKSRRLGVFLPKGIFTPAPHLSGSLARSNLVKYSMDSSSVIEKNQLHELISWGITPHDGKEHWYSTYPTPKGGNLENALQTLEIWKDYYSELISIFDSSEEGWGAKDMVIWKRVAI